MIKLLDKSTIDKIAAGEVIERPLSVVKELLDNSIDAGATSVTVEIKDGGMSFIRVTDNGIGIPKDQVKTAYMRHATSKIEDARDLAAITTLGFRGEALSTIAAVSQTEMITKTVDELTGVKYVIHGGEEIEFTEVGVPDGTTIVARNLFYNTPARKKFLKSAMTEGSYISDLVLKIALSHPEISFKLIVNNQTKLDTSGNGNTKDTIYQLFGRDITSSLIPVNAEAENIKITGFIGKPFIARGNRSLENYFVNGRYIKSGIVNRAIEEGFKTFVMQHKFPFTVLYIELPPEKCDVNVHPTKMEFKYDNERELFEIITRMVREALTHKEIIPKEISEHPKEAVNKGPKPAEPFEVNRKQIPGANTRAGSYSPTYKILEALKAREASEKSDYSNPAATLLEQTIKQESNNYIPKQKMPEPEAKVNEEKVKEATNKENEVNVQEDIIKSNEINVQEDAVRTSNKQAINAYKPYEQKQMEGSNAALNIVNESNGAIYKNTKADNVQASLFDDDFLTEKAKKKHRIIGQVFGTYWLIEYERNLYIMDQHAAHEKIKYEELMSTLNLNNPMSQLLMPPMVISVSYAEKQIILDNFDLFFKIGYDIEEFGGNEFKINAVPSNLFGLHGRQMFLDFVASLEDNAGYISNDIFIKKLSTMACKAAIKGNTTISFQEADALITKLLSLENPYTCPHGRPTIISMSESELEKKFKRQV